MGSVFHFIIGFIGGVISTTIGLIIISLIIGFIFPPALVVIIPIGLFVIIKAGWDSAIERVESHQYTKKVKRNNKAEAKRKEKLRKEFDEHELFEFDRAWRETSRNG